jgi:hypothetical protein
VKTCKKCGETKELTEFFKDASLKDGHSGACKKCRNAYKREWYKNNAEKSRASRIKFYEKNKDDINAKKRENRNTDEYRAKRRATRDLEKNKIYCRKYYAKNYKTKIKPKHDEYYARPEINERIKEYRRMEYQLTGKERNKRKIADVEPRYIREIMKQNGRLKGVEIPQSLIEAKRLEILIKRRVKNENSNDTTQ